MEIKLLKLNLEYFKYQNNLIKSSEIDNRFNDLVNYLNDEILFKLNNLNERLIIGSTIQSDINCILKSKLDTGYFWKKVDDYDFTKSSIDITKLNLSNLINSILIVNNLGNIELLQNTNLEENVILAKDNVFFDKIDNNYIDPNIKIKTEKIKTESIIPYNLTNIKLNIAENTVLGSSIADYSIVTSKIADNSISLESFNLDTQELLKKYIWETVIPKNFINLNTSPNKTIINTKWDRYFLNRTLFNYNVKIGPSNIPSFKINISKFTGFHVKNIIKYYTSMGGITDLSVKDSKGNMKNAEKRYILSSNNFKPNSINSNRLVCWFYTQNNDKYHNINDIIEKSTLKIEHFSPAIQNKLNQV